LGVTPSSGVQQVTQGMSQMSRVTGRVFSISGDEASQLDSLVRGMCSMFEAQLYALFDCRVTLSFMSYDNDA